MEALYFGGDGALGQSACVRLNSSTLPTGGNTDGLRGMFSYRCVCKVYLKQGLTGLVFAPAPAPAPAPTAEAGPLRGQQVRPEEAGELDAGLRDGDERELAVERGAAAREGGGRGKEGKNKKKKLKRGGHDRNKGLSSLAESSTGAGPPAAKKRKAVC